MDRSIRPLMEVLSHALRGAIVAPPGRALYVADYASIEARVVMWLAGETGALRLFATGADIYCDMAGDIYGRPITKAEVRERGMGKIAILGLGYQMGWSKFQSQCADAGAVIDDEFAQQVVNAYRQKYWRVKQMWGDTEAAAINAVLRGRTDGRHADSGGAYHVQWFLDGRFLRCFLPSGRSLAYPDPQVRKRQTPWGESRNALTFMGVNAYSHKWTRQSAYGGLLVENITQAVARDVMAEAMLRLERDRRFLPILTVHDEIVCEATPARTLRTFERLVAAVPEWADGLPIACESWKGKRYHK